MVTSWRDLLSHVRSRMIHGVPHPLFSCRTVLVILLCKRSIWILIGRRVPRISFVVLLVTHSVLWCVSQNTEHLLMFSVWHYVQMKWSGHRCDWGCEFVETKPNGERPNELAFLPRQWIVCVSTVGDFVNELQTPTPGSSTSSSFRRLLYINYSTTILRQDCFIIEQWHSVLPSILFSNTLISFTLISRVCNRTAHSVLLYYTILFYNILHYTTLH